MPRTPAGAPVHRIECGCGFAVEGSEDEAVAAARRHAEEVHGMELADGIVRALARPLGRGGSVPGTDRKPTTGATG